MDHMKITAGVVGASGYSGEILLEILSAHPRVSKLIVASRSHSGEPVEDHLPRLAGLLNGTRFTEADPQLLSTLPCDIWFLALPHGVASQFALPLQNSGKCVIDLSADFRLNDPGLYQQYYGAPHPAADLLSSVPYVLPELSTGWQDANLIACPGCYPSSVLFPLIPLYRAGLLPTKGVQIFAMSGVSGAGKKESLYYSYCERSESAVAYGLGKHRHLSEIEEQLSLAAGTQVTVQFTPHLVPMMRGIATTIGIPNDRKTNLTAIYTAWQDAYAGCKGIRVLPSGSTPETRAVLGRNRVDMSAFVDTRTHNIIITSAIDNLMKGASGQAVQIMNLKMGWDAFCGLK